MRKEQQTGTSLSLFLFCVLKKGALTFGKKQEVVKNDQNPRNVQFQKINKTVLFYKLA